MILIIIIWKRGQTHNSLSPRVIMQTTQNKTSCCNNILYRLYILLARSFSQWPLWLTFEYLMPINDTIWVFSIITIEQTAGWSCIQGMCAYYYIQCTLCRPPNAYCSQNTDISSRNFWDVNNYSGIKYNNTHSKVDAVSMLGTDEHPKRSPDLPENTTCNGGQTPKRVMLL